MLNEDICRTFQTFKQKLTDCPFSCRYDADGNEIEAREPKKKDKKPKRGTADFEYDADGNEIEERGTADFEYDADGNEIEARGTADFGK